MTGEPGPRYWQQWTSYRLAARLVPAAKRVEGSARLRYTNNSPDTLRSLHVQLLQNLHAPGAMRNTPEEVTGGIALSRVSVQGVQLDSIPSGTGGFLVEQPDSVLGSHYRVAGTDLEIRAPRPVLPREAVDLDFEWSFQVPQKGASGRMGWSKDDLYFIAYWYPQMAVYDDVVGWQTDPFLGTAEFYAGFADYDVTIEAPADWTVIATGELENPTEVLPRQALKQLQRAESSDSVVTVLAPEDIPPPVSSESQRLTWHFRADSVRDFAFSATRESRWDAARTPVGDRDGDGKVDYARVDALWRAPAPRWANVARYAQHAIRFHSEFTGLPYPWSHMTVVEGSGIIGGGMEFPMLTLIGDYNARGDSALYYVVAHELAHMWVPMIVANDERRYSWLDEGTTTFNESQARKDFFPGSKPDSIEQQEYLVTAIAGTEGEIMRRSDYHYPGDAYGTASYPKPASVLVALRGLLGEKTFLRAYRTFLRRWAYKHPYPWDLFHTFESESGQDLDWFWRTWYYETWTLDQAVASVAHVTGKAVEEHRESREDRDGGESPEGSERGATRIVIEDRGTAPMPVDLTITRADGTIETERVPVDVWLTGASSTTVTVPAGSPVTRVEIDATHAYPDVDRSNNVWTVGS